LNSLHPWPFKLLKLYYCYEMNNIDWMVWMHKCWDYWNYIIAMKWITYIEQLNPQVLRLLKLYHYHKINNMDWTVWIHKCSAYSNCIIHLKSMRQIEHFQHMCIQSIQTVWLHSYEWHRLNTLNPWLFK